MMNTDRIPNLLGKLQADPDSSEPWDELTDALTSPDGAIDPSAIHVALSSAAETHRDRGEYGAVARLCELALSTVTDQSERAGWLLLLATVRRDNLFEERLSVEAFQQLKDLGAGEVASQALQEHEERSGRWQELADTYAREVESATDDVYRSSMLMRSAEMELRFAESPSLDGVVERLEQAVRLDATNVQAGLMLERCYRRSESWEDVARVLERLASRGAEQHVRVQTALRLGRLCRYRLKDTERTTVAYERLLRESPGNPEAMEYLYELYSAEERYDELVALYERDLKRKDLTNPDSLGDLLQIALLHYKKRGRPEDAEIWFERVRRLSPSHEVALEFFREYCRALDDETRLVEVLQNATNVMVDGPRKAALATEIAELLEKQENAQRAIEQYKTILRQDPDNEHARESLKRLYKATSGFTALVELLRQQLERTPAEQYKKRLDILREVATVYRQYVHSDTSLVTVLHQIVQLDERLDENDVEELRELVQLYDKLGRHRELLTYQTKLAQVTPDVDEKVTLLRTVARRWLEQFTNFQNATEAYESLIQIAPGDEEACERLNELYRRRRAWGPLYELLSQQSARCTGSARIALLREMAELAAERLHKVPEAVRLYRTILDEDSSRVDVLDALEKHAERNRDFDTLAFALEKRVERAVDDASKSTFLQRLGTVYGEHLGDAAASIKTWRRVLELNPGHARALRVLRDAYLQTGDYDALTELYASQNDWEGLAEVLSNAADRTNQSELKVALSLRAAAVFEERLMQPERAMRSYERMLLVDASDIRAVIKLVPIYEGEEKWVRLPALYELMVSATENVEEKVAILFRMIEVMGQRLLDKKGAAAAARRAWELVPTSEQAQLVFETATRAAASWDSYVEAIEMRLASMAAEPVVPAAGQVAPDAEEGRTKKKGKKKGKRAEAEAIAEGAPSSSPESGERRSLELVLARVQAVELGNLDAAVQTYRTLLTRLPDDSEADEALSQLLTVNDRRDDLRWLYEHRIANAADAEARVAILCEFAEREETFHAEPARAIQVYERVLGLVPTHQPALAATARLLLSEGDVARAAAVMEREREILTGDARQEIELALAELYLVRLERPADALAAAVRVLDVVSEPRALSVVERLLDVEQVRTQAAEVLAGRFASMGEPRREAQALGVLLLRADSRSTKLELVHRLCDLHADRLGERSAALDFALHALSEYPEELELWDRAEGLAVAAGRPTDLADSLRRVLSAGLPPDLELKLCERAARLHEERLGDPVGATPYLERMLALSPGNERAFGRLKDILTAAERWGELEAMYGRAIELIDDRSRRIEMLSEVALIGEEIVGDPMKAIGYYERILELDTLNQPALETLDRLYSRYDRCEPLAMLLGRRLQIAEGEEAVELKRRLAVLLLDKLHRPEDAIGYVEDVLNGDPNDHDARALGERILGIVALRARMARALETVYETRDEVRDLVRILIIRLECLDGQVSDETASERRELLRRVATLRDERLHDDAGAFEYLARYVPVAAGDADARARLVEIGRRLQNGHEIERVLTEAFAEAKDNALRAEVGMQLAEVEQNMLLDVPAAERTFCRVVELDPRDPSVALPAAEALERIYSQTQQMAQLADILRIQVGLVDRVEERREIHRRLGRIHRDDLADPKGAILAYSACLEDDPTDGDALAALDELYQGEERYPELSAILERRRDNATAPELRRTLATRRAELLSEKLGQLDGAIAVWQSVVDEFGPEDEALGALERLFERKSAWHELGSCLEQHIDVTTDGAQRLELLAYLGEVRCQRLSDPNGALSVYREALDVDPGHQRTRTALLAMLKDAEPSVRRESAHILHPVFEAEQNGELLLRVLSIEVEFEDDPAQRQRLFAMATTVAEERLSDPVRAFEYASRATREALGSCDLSGWLSRLERLGRASQLASKHVALLREIVGDIFDGDVQLAVTLKIASMARDDLSDRVLAREYFEKALELRPEELSALVALEHLHEESGDAPHLLEILVRRAEVAENEAEQKELLFRQARLLEEQLGDRARAVEVYERIVDIDFDPQAISALDRLYRELSRFQALIVLLQRRLDRATTDKADLLAMTAKVYAVHIHDVARALDELEQALAVDAGHEASVALLEGLLVEGADPEQRARAATLLEPVYVTRGEPQKVLGTLQARLDATAMPEERRELLSRMAAIHEEQIEDYGAALETMAILFHEDWADVHVHGELERLAKVASAERRLAEILAGELQLITVDDPSSAQLAIRAGELFADQGDLDRALVHYRRALRLHPDNPQLFAAIDGILYRLELHQERVALYRDSLPHRFDPEDRLGALHVIVALQRYQLNQAEEAILSLREALEVDDAHAPTLDALTELYRQQSEWSELAELLLHRAERATDSSEAAVYRVQLAELWLTELRNADRAVDQLEEVVREIPDHQQAILKLEELRALPDCRQRVVEILRPLYEAADDWQSIIRLNEDRFELATDVASRVAVLRETAELYERRANDDERARQALVLALDADPSDLEVRAEFERLSEVTGQFAHLVEVYQKILDEQPDLVNRRDLVAVVANTYDARLDDPRRALSSFAALHELEPEDLATLEQMERLATLLSDWTTLVTVLVEKSELVLGDEERAGCLRRVGEARRDMLEDPIGAVEAYEKALDIEPGSAFTVDCLIGLLEGGRNNARLVELLVRRVELCDSEEAELKYEHLLRAAALVEAEGSDQQRAIDLYVQALELRPHDASVLGKLSVLYEGEHQWPELLSNLRLQASLSDEPEVRARLQARMGQVLSHEMSDFDEALEAYRLVLVDAPDDENTIESVFVLGRDHEEHREKVAEILIPVLIARRASKRLVDVLELRFSVEVDPSERGGTLREISRIWELELAGPVEALDALLRAVTELPGDEALHDEINRLAAATDGYRKVADVLDERARATFDPDLVCDLCVRLGQVAEDKLADPRRAVDAYRRALDQTGDRGDLLAALDRLYVALDDADSLAEVLERRAIVELSATAIAELYYRLALLQIEKFDQPGQAIGTLRMALDRVGDHQGSIDVLESLSDRSELFEEVVEVLEPVYRAISRTDRLAILFEKRVGFASTPGDRLEMRRSLARVLEEDCGDSRAATSALLEGLKDDPSDPLLLDEIERLAGVTSAFESVASTVSGVLSEATTVPQDTLRDLWLRVAGWYRDQVGNSGAAEKCLLAAARLDPGSEEILTQLEALYRGTGQQRELLEVLRQRARLVIDEDNREQIYREAAGIASSLGDSALNEAVVRELLAVSDGNLWALRELTELRRRAEDHEETLSLLLRQLDIEVDAQVLVRLRHEAGQIARGPLGRLDKAIELFWVLVDDNPQDEVAATALCELLTATSRFDDLCRILERKLDLATSTEQRRVVRLEMAEIRERLGDSESAMDLLRAVLEEEPDQSVAVLPLSRLLEQNGRDSELAELLERQIEGARERADDAAELELTVRLAEVCESRLNDCGRAITAYRCILERHPTHVRSLVAVARLLEAASEMEELATTLAQLVVATEGQERVVHAEHLANVRRQMGDADGEAAALVDALKVDERDERLRARLRNLYTELGNFGQLALLVERESDLAAEVPVKVALLRQAADVYRTKLSDNSAAAAMLQRASSLTPDDRELLLELCDAYNDSGRADLAAEALERIVASYGGRRSKELADIHRRLGEAYLTQNQPERAKEEYEKAFRIEPGNVRVIVRLAEVSMSIGDAKRAHQLYGSLMIQVQKLEPGGPITKALIYARRAEASLALGEREKAKNDFERALQADGSLDWVREKLAELKASP